MSLLAFRCYRCYHTFWKQNKVKADVFFQCMAYTSLLQMSPHCLNYRNIKGQNMTVAIRNLTIIIMLHHGPES